MCPIGHLATAIPTLAAQKSSTITKAVTDSVASRVTDSERAIGITLLAYYNGLLGSVDILPAQHDYDNDAESISPPHDNIRSLLQDLRARYPQSRIWRIEESRLCANDKDTSRAIKLLSTWQESPLKQITAVKYFELGINAIVTQKWDLMRDTFLRCLEISNWSPVMYYFIAAYASLELYRDAYYTTDTAQNAKATYLKNQAEEYLRKEPLVSGKQRLMARQLPLEIFA
ncbi:hypothetical protein UVI_02061580 [Ustilaginoidea virens]|uniref:Inclusion body clearance protein IML2 n=1 Tax=Ustilaginoidea virens TaxID=1159556 RepID=A0A1B5L8P7_USTVR|nr:hypothetical protein UVI_02061580 [Ustilaginoidea virens]